MDQNILLKLEDRKVELEKEIAENDKKMREFSQQVSQIQVLILELRGELKGLIKMINSLKEK